MLDTVGAQVAFTAILSGREGVVARAVVGLPGLASDPQFATFPSFSQANEFAQRLNEGLGLTPSQARAIVTDVLATAQALISECDSLVQMARELRLRSRHRYQYPELESVLTQLEVGVTFCNTACIRRDVRKERLIQNASNALCNAVSAMRRFEFTMDGVEQIKAGMDVLENALEECYVNA